VPSEEETGKMELKLIGKGALRNMRPEGWKALECIPFSDTKQQEKGMHSRERESKKEKGGGERI